MARNMVRSSLERQLSCQLKGARTAGAEDSTCGANWFSKGRSQRGIAAVGDEDVEESEVVGIARAKDIAFIEQVEHFADSLQVEALGEMELARQAQVKGVECVVEAGVGRNHGEGRAKTAISCPLCVELSQEGVEFGASVELAGAGVASKFGDAVAAAVAEQDIHGNAGSVGPQRRKTEVEREISCALHDQAMALVVGRGTVFAMQVGGIDRRIAEWDLIVVRVIQRF